tara:strand:+ start:3159 stop:3530 length:372 start_codon:yes stop_codon:yes gene_type:complete
MKIKLIHTKTQPVNAVYEYDSTLKHLTSNYFYDLPCELKNKIQREVAINIIKPYILDFRELMRSQRLLAWYGEWDMLESQYSTYEEMEIYRHQIGWTDYTLARAEHIIESYNRNPQKYYRLFC